MRQPPERGLVDFLTGAMMQTAQDGPRLKAGVTSGCGRVERKDMSSRSNHQRLQALEAQMQAAAEAMDFEEAARLRNEIARLKGEAVAKEDEDTVTVGQPPPGAVGLGTHVPVREPPKGWVKPKKPDWMKRGK